MLSTLTTHISDHWTLVSKGALTSQGFGCHWHTIGWTSQMSKASGQDITSDQLTYGQVSGLSGVLFVLVTFQYYVNMFFPSINT